VQNLPANAGSFAYILLTFYCLCHTSDFAPLHPVAYPLAGISEPMQVAETFTFPIPADQLPADIRTQLAKLLPAGAAAARRAACPTGNCPVITAAAGVSSKADDDVDAAVDIIGSNDADDKAAKKGSKGKKKGGKKKGGSGEEEEASQELEVRLGTHGFKVSKVPMVTANTAALMCCLALWICVRCLVIGS
jgi:hypothetical protein